MDGCARILVVTPGNLRQSHLYVRGHYDFFPTDCFGPARKSAPNKGRDVEIFLEGLNETVKTDIATDRRTGKPRGFFRGRIWVRRFFQHHKLSAGDRLRLERVATRKYRLCIQSKLATTPKPGLKGDCPVISLFSGAMGLDLGLEQAGIQTSLAVEIDEVCCATMRKNRPKLDVWEIDATKLDGKALLTRLGNPKEVFLMVGGPPCQSFCSGGKRAGLSDPRGNLIYVYLKLLQEIRPHYFVLENVANIITAALRHRPIDQRPGRQWNLSIYSRNKPKGDNSARPMSPDELSGSAIRQIIADVSEVGYHLSFSIVDSADYGAPQHRLRFIMFGARDTKAPLAPIPTHADDSVDRLPVRTARDAIYDLKENPGPHSKYTPEVARFFELIPPGGNWRHLPKDLQRDALGAASMAAGGGKTGFYRRLAWDAPSPTITGRANRKGSALCHPEAVRPLSVRECARLQGFPDAWDFLGSMNRQYLQVGNAVPTQLGAAIGQALCAALDGGKKPEQNSFDLEQALILSLRRLRSSARNKKCRNDRQPTWL
jgi:DNA (cytosine-5)-methyltransferase 1